MPFFIKILDGKKTPLYLHCKNDHFLTQVRICLEGKWSNFKFGFNLLWSKIKFGFKLLCILLTVHSTNIQKLSFR
jgi:hypothetical protein